MGSSFIGNALLWRDFFFVDEYALAKLRLSFARSQVHRKSVIFDPAMSFGNCRDVSRVEDAAHARRVRVVHFVDAQEQSDIQTLFFGQGANERVFAATRAASVDQHRMVSWRSRVPAIWEILHVFGCLQKVLTIV